MKTLLLIIALTLLTAWGYRYENGKRYPRYFKDPKTELCFAFIETDFAIGLTNVPCTKQVEGMIGK